MLNNLNDLYCSYINNIMIKENFRNKFTIENNLFRMNKI